MSRVASCKFCGISPRRAAIAKLYIQRRQAIEDLRINRRKNPCFFKSLQRLVISPKVLIGTSEINLNP